MTNSRALIARLALPLAATFLALTACGSSTSGGDADPAAPPSATVTSDAMESEPMESMGSEPMESEPMASEASEPMESEPMESMASEPAAAGATSGAYLTLAEYEDSQAMYADGDVVFFFAADWCPTCQEATRSLEADPAAIPAGLAIVRVDYDDSADLKRKYGVTVQHTFVQVDADGNELAKWSGSVTADEIARQTV